jgi:EmrB/QacA subfamily drug resistance transporter
MKDNALKLLVVLFGQLLTIIDIFIINVSIPSIQKDLDAGNGEMQLIISCYLIGFASFLITGGRLGDLYGRKKIFLIGLLFFMLSSVACGLSSHPVWLMIARFAQGLSAALMSPQVLSIIQILFPGHDERTRAMGWYGISIGIGTLSGQFLGGYFSSFTFMKESWRLIFLINIPICLLAILLGWKILDESKNLIKGRLDLMGACLLASGLFCFTYALAMMEHANGKVKNFLLLLLSGVILFFFIKNQKSRIRKSKSYLIDFDLFDFKNFNIGIIAVSFFFIMLDSYFYVLSLFFQDGLKIGPLASGEIIVFQGLGFILASIVSPTLVLRYGKKFLIFGLAIIVAVLMAQVYLFSRQSSFLLLYVLLFIHGVGVGSVIPSLATIALSGIPEKLTGNASGVYITFQQSAAIIGIILIGSVFYHFLGIKPLFVDYQNAFSAALLTNVLCLIVVAVCIWKTPGSLLIKVNNSF